MTQHKRKIGWLCSALTVAASIGCGGSETADQAQKPAPVHETQEAPDADVEPELPDEPAAPEEKKTVYEPPFPRRTNLFTPVQKQRVARSDDDSGESVVLKGFGNVGEPKVLLAINGEVVALSAGMEHYGVEVITIQPPEVVLKSRSGYWTATLQ